MLCRVGVLVEANIVGIFDDKDNIILLQQQFVCNKTLHPKLSLVLNGKIWFTPLFSKLFYNHIRLLGSNRTSRVIVNVLLSSSNSPKKKN